MNPIFRREFLARWRDWRSHALLLTLALLLSGSAYWAYQQAVSFVPQTVQMQVPAMGTGAWVGITRNGGRFIGRRWTGSWKTVTMIQDPLTGRLSPVVFESMVTRTARAGHGLFTTLSLVNVGMWFVLAPMLLATGVAREREHGLLESLQLSPMRPASQILARTLSALSFLAALQLVSLPVYWIAFSFGGVSPGEIKSVWEVVAATAFCGVGLGLMLSAQAHRPSSALFGVVAVLVAWSVMAFIGSAFGLSRSVLWSLGTWPNSLGQAFYFSHPVALAWQICNDNTSTYGMTFAFPMGVRVMGATDVLPYALGGWCLLGALGLLKATRDVTRALPPSEWAGRNTLIGKWKARREQRLREQRAKRLSVEGALLADLPFERLIRFKNPLLNREVKSRFRLRRGSVWSWAGRTVVFLVGVSAWLTVIFTGFFDPAGRVGAATTVLRVEWLLGVTLVGIWASGEFAREREAGTWEGLQLSLLGSGDITRTKWASPLVAFAFWTCPLWLLLLALVPIGPWSGEEFRWIALGAGVVVASLSLVSALGAWISLRAKSSTHATCWTIGVLLVLWGVPTVSGGLLGAVSAWNPMVILSGFDQRHNSTPNYYQPRTLDEDALVKMSLFHIALCLAGTLGFLLLVRRALDDTGTRRSSGSDNRRPLNGISERLEGINGETPVAS